MQYIWTNYQPKTHSAIFRDGRVLKLTQIQYEELASIKQKEKSNYIIRIKNTYSGKIDYHWEIWAIKEFRELNRENNSEYSYYCNICWRLNKINIICECHNEYKNCNFNFEDAKNRAKNNYDLLKKIEVYGLIIDESQNLIKLKNSTLPF